MFVELEGVAEPDGRHEEPRRRDTAEPAEPHHERAQDPGGMEERVGSGGARRPVSSALPASSSFPLAVGAFWGSEGVGGRPKASGHGHGARGGHWAWFCGRRENGILIGSDWL